VRSIYPTLFFRCESVKCLEKVSEIWVSACK